MNKKNNSKKPIFILFAILSMLIPVIIMVTGGAVIGIEPFGQNSFLVSDTNNQFVAFYTYFKHTILKGENPLYSLSKTLGGDMTGFWGYYLQNPFAFFLFLFPDEKISVGIFWMISLQLGCMGLSCYLFLLLRPSSNKEETYSVRRQIVHLICACSYALMGYIMAYLTLPMYFCSLILFPIVILGIERFLNNSKHFLLYVISLSLTVWCNYYIGYMICIFCALYCIKELCVRKNQKIKEKIIILVKFAGVSVISVLIDSFSLIPTVLSLAGEKALNSDSILSFRKLYGFTGLFRNMLPGTFSCDFSNLSAPYVYAGILMMAGCLVFFLALIRKEPRLIIVNLFFLIFLIVSTYVSIADVVWHGFNEPVGFAHRQAFVIPFCIILFADEGLLIIAERIPSIAIWVLAGLQILDLGYNAVASLQSYHNYEMKSQIEYEEFYREMSDVISETKTNDNSLYRLEKDVEYNHNDALLFNYPGLSHNSSCEKDYIREFMGRIGFRNQGIWSFYYQGNTAFADSVLGIKYLISRFDSTNKPYTHVFNNDVYFSYNNPQALSLGFVVPNDYGDVHLYNRDVFANQNTLALATGGISDIFTPVDYTVSLTGLTEEEITSFEDNKSAGLGEIPTPKECLYYQRKSVDERAVIEYNINIDEACNMYCYFSAPNQQGCDLYVNDNYMDDYFSDYRWAVTNLGSFREGDSVKVSLELKDDDLKIYDAFFYKENLDALHEWYENASQEKVDVKKLNSAYYRGTVHCKEDRILVFSIPYEKGMHVMLDGERAETFKMFDALLAVKIGKGNHDFELRYFPDGINLGIALSVISLALLIVISLKKNKNLKIK